MATACSLLRPMWMRSVLVKYFRYAQIEFYMLASMRELSDNMHSGSP